MILNDLREYSQETYIKKTQDVKTKTSKLKEWLPMRNGSGVGWDRKNGRWEPDRY